MAAAVQGGAGYGQELGNVDGRLGRQHPGGLQAPEVALAAGPDNSPLQGADAAIVGGDGQQPVAEMAVVAAQLAQGAVGRLHEVAPVVTPFVDAHAKAADAVAHELPQAHGAGARDGPGLKLRLNKGNEEQFLWQTVIADTVQGVGAVGPRTEQHRLQPGAPAVGAVQGHEAVVMGVGQRRRQAEPFRPGVMPEIRRAGQRLAGRRGVGLVGERVTQRPER